MAANSAENLLMPYVSDIHQSDGLWLAMLSNYFHLQNLTHGVKMENDFILAIFAFIV